MPQNDERANWPASLFRRVLAFAVDYLAIAACLLGLTAVAVVLGRATPAVEATFGHRAMAQLIGFLLVTLPVTLYFALQESSGWQATWGKRTLGLKVVAAASGAPITLPRALGRTVLKFVPWELAHTMVWEVSFAPGDPSPLVTIGFVAVWALIGANVASVLVTGDGRAIYDSLAGTRVVRVS